MKRKRPVDPGIELLARNGRTPAPPIRMVGLRFTKSEDRFVPCTPDDKRATIRTQYDAAGRSVEAVFDDASIFADGLRQTGWRITAGAMDNPMAPSAAEVVAFLAAPATRRKLGVVS